jgi:hypothetical protein
MELTGALGSRIVNWKLICAEYFPKMEPKKLQKKFENCCKAKNSPALLALEERRPPKLTRSAATSVEQKVAEFVKNRYGEIIDELTPIFDQDFEVECSSCGHLIQGTKLACRLCEVRYCISCAKLQKETHQSSHWQGVGDSCSHCAANNDCQTNGSVHYCRSCRPNDPLKAVVEQWEMEYKQISEGLIKVLKKRFAVKKPFLLQVIESIRASYIPSSS